MANKLNRRQFIKSVGVIFGALGLPKIKQEQIEQEQTIEQEPKENEYSELLPKLLLAIDSNWRTVGQVLDITGCIHSCEDYGESQFFSKRESEIEISLSKYNSHIVTLICKKPCVDTFRLELRNIDVRFEFAAYTSAVSYDNDCCRLSFVIVGKPEMDKIKNEQVDI